MSIKFTKFFSLLFFLLLSGHVWSEEAYVLRVNQGKSELWSISGEGKNIIWKKIDQLEKTPRLGSLWKVFVYSFFVETQKGVTPYSCEGHNKKGNFCSLMRGHGGVDLDRALIVSCELGFDQFVQSISKNEWQDFWKKSYFPHQPPQWLLEVLSLRSQLRVDPHSLLDTFGVMRHFKNFPRIQKTLSRVVTEGTASGKNIFTGEKVPKIKTYTMGNSSIGYEGGFAGYWIDGSLLWIFSQNKGGRIFNRWASILEKKWPKNFETAQKKNEFTVCTHFLNRYPLTQIFSSKNVPASSGPLFGSFTAVTEKGSKVDFMTQGEVFLVRQNGRPQLTACLELEDYVARVIEREGSLLKPETQKLLGVLARNYVFFNAQKINNELWIKDSTLHQRVSLSKAHPQHRAMALATEGLVLGQPLQYHLNKNEKGTISLSEADRLARDQLNYQQILNVLLPGKRTESLANLIQSVCPHFDVAQKWLQYQTPIWSRELAFLGLDVDEDIQVCQSDQEQPLYFKGRIYISQFQNSDDQVALAHEWLHAIFSKQAPHIQEQTIEDLARKLVLTGKAGQLNLGSLLP